MKFLIMRFSQVIGRGMPIHAAFWIVLLPGLSVMAVCGPAAAATPSPEFFKYKSYRLNLNWTGGESAMKSTQDKQVDADFLYDCKNSETLTSTLNGSVSIKLVLTESGGIYLWEAEDGVLPEGNISYQGSFTKATTCSRSSGGSKSKSSGGSSREDKPPGGSTQMVLTGGGLGDSGGRFEIDRETGEFRMFGYATASTQQVKMISSDMQFEQPPASDTGLSLFPNQIMEDITGMIPSSGSRLKGGPVDVPLYLGPWFARKPLQFTWSLEPWEENAAPEVMVQPNVGYEQWIPVGNLKNPKEPGGTLAVSVRVHKKGAPLKPDKATIKLDLTDISEEKGVCMNWPEKEKAVAGKGLRFRKEDQVEPEEKLKIIDENHAATTGDVESVILVVGSYDYGAWGSLRVSGSKNGKSLKVETRGMDTPYLHIPLDDNGNMIADGWEKEKGVSGQPGNSDEETTEGNEHRGDGLTLYEEYRGFVVKGEHHRAEPKKRDLYICDTTAGKVADPGIDLFEKSSGLKVWKINLDEVTKDRVINPNHVKGPHHVDQHALIIQDAPDGETAPQAVAMNPDKGEIFGPPQLTRYINLPKGAKYGEGGDLVDVVHEIGHAVGVPHHGDGALFYSLWKWQVGSDGNWHLYEGDLDVDTNPPTIKGGLRSKPIEVYDEAGSADKSQKYGDKMPLTGGIGWDESLQGWMLQTYTQGGEFSGDVECFMRYEDKQAFFRKGDDVKRYLVDHTQDRPRIHFCKNQFSTFTNKDSHKPFSRGGSIVLGDRGECFKRIVVNDADGP